MSEWIDVEERLPEDLQEVLTLWLEEEQIKVQRFYLVYGAAGGPWWMFGGQNHLLEDGHITHWMPLPPLPHFLILRVRPLWKRVLRLPKTWRGHYRLHREHHGRLKSGYLALGLCRLLFKQIKS